jgi:D-alanyl-lipoteichoic acid acyltransferase DltB (MBOAT superfamily)
MAFIPIYILILAVTIIIDYFAGMWIEDSQGKRKKMFLIVSILSTCLVLFIFKYFNFFNSSFSSIAHFFHWNYPIGIINIILPIGLSFHTFQSLSYVIEVYRGYQKAERHFGIYSLYVMFYPQLVAGPIERPQNLLQHFREEHYFEYKRVTDGLKLMAWGMFKKVVIADRLSILINQVYGNPTEYAGLPLIIATVFFAFQIYCDFSGYSDIAIGAAQVMGFKLMDNFNRPYFSKSISEFWKRWHISLSTWFRDYLYISLGGNKVPKWRWQFNLLITFLISGLWHGANWTYVIWGGLNGFYLVFAILTEDTREKIAKIIGLSKYPKIRKYWQILATFSLICFAWIFFRAKNLSDAWYIVTHLFTGIEHIFSVKYLKETVGGLGFSKSEFLIAILSIIFMEFVHLVQRHYKIRHMLSEKPAWFRWSMYYAIILGIIFWGVFGKNDFIYFQF